MCERDVWEVCNDRELEYLSKFIYKNDMIYMFTLEPVSNLYYFILFNNYIYFYQ